MALACMLGLAMLPAMLHNEVITMTIETIVTATSIEFVSTNGRGLTLQLRDLSTAIIGHATLHGLKAKIGDAGAISRNPDTGKSATDDDKLSAMQAVMDRLLSGDWNKTRAEGSGGNGGLLFRALCLTYPTKTAEAIREFLAKKSNEEKAALRKVPVIAGHILTLQAAAMRTDNIDVEGLLGELND